jgi:hypothetical protein
MLEVGLIDYVSTHRWKRAEYEGLAQIDEDLKYRLLPNIIMPPMSARDIEKNRKLTRDEFAAVQVGRLSQYWGRRPCLVDCRFVEFAPSQRTDAKRLFAFLSAASRFGCGVMPVLDLRTNEYRLESIRRHWIETQNGLALRLSLGDLQKAKLEGLVQQRLVGLGGKPSDCFLLMDFSEADLSDQEDFANFAYEWILKLQQIGNWRRIIIQATNFPERNPAAPNSSVRVARSEWTIWKSLVRRDPSLPNSVTFGDFGADNARFSFDGGGLPITHLRYALENEWLIVRGGPPTKKGDGTIKQVAKEISESGVFSGSDFSAGDERIALWASDAGVPTGATEWRKVNMVHHWTRVLVDTTALRGSTVIRRPRARAPLQGDLFASNSDPVTGGPKS